MKLHATVRGFALALIAAAVTFVGGCSFLQESPGTARIATTYATLKVIDEDPDRADRVIEIATEVLVYTTDDPEATVDALIARITTLIDWDKLDRADTILVQALLMELDVRLTELLGEGVIPEDARVTVRTLAEWVIETAETETAG